MSTKYPKDIAASLSTDKTFAIRAELFPTDVNKGDAPLKMYNEYSRFVFTILVKTENGMKNVNGNLSVDEVPGLIMESYSAALAHVLVGIPGLQMIGKSIMSLHTELDGLKKGLANLFFFIKNGKLPEKKQAVLQIKSADSVQISTGMYKGKTPLQVLKEDPSARSGLVKQAEFLRRNLKKYPKNQLQINAIEEALRLLDNGSLTMINTDTATDNTIYLHQSGPRALVRRKKDAEGFYPVWEMDIMWHFNNRYPVEIVITNYKAPVVTLETGQINPQKSQAKDISKLNYRLSMKEWMRHCSRISRTMQNFETIYALKQFKDSEAAYKENMNAAKMEADSQ